MPLDAVVKIRKEHRQDRLEAGRHKDAQEPWVQESPPVHLRGQHDARLLAYGTSVFDNRTGRSQLAAAGGAASGSTEQARTATLLESISDPTVPVSKCCGSARRLGNGDWLLDWGLPRVIGGYNPTARGPSA